MRRLSRLIIVTCLVRLSLPLAAQAASRMYVGFQDDQSFRFAPDRQALFDQARQAGATVIRVTVEWAAVAPTAPANASNPFDPAYRLDDVDEAVRNAQSRGIEVLMSIWGTPGWANGNAGLNHMPKNLNTIKSFAKALSARYSGRYAGFPHVRFWSVWNESNLDQFLAPQFDSRGRSVGPANYAKLYQAAYSGIKAGNKPLRVEIDKIALSDFYSRLIVNADGTLNVQGIMVRGSKESQSPKMTQADSAKPRSAEDANSAAVPTAEPPTPVTINTVTMQGGNISFSDRYIKPNYSARLSELGGRISGLSSEETRRADVDLRGKLDGGSPLQIVGNINPLGRDLFVDIRVDFKDIELSTMTPYAAKYAGYAIEKGKLSLSLKYLIEKRMVNAQNKILLDQFTFGDKVDSPTATKLPVRFAVSLLKDRNGLIDLDLPVTGSLDDPQFSVWAVIGQVLSNLLTKAATAPFALLGSLVGGAPELSHIEFAYGSADLDSPAQDKLKTLAKVLFERPALKLEIAGHVDTKPMTKRLTDKKARAQHR